MPFKFACPSCGVGYNIKEKLTGKRTKCQKCGEPMTLTPPEQKVTTGGSEVYEHVARDRDLELATGDADAIEAISNHIEQHIGPIESVFHELVSDLVHLDIHWIAPTPDRPWNVLFTTGMSERPMTVPKEAEASEYTELVMCLPGDWPLTQDAFKNENNYWPVRWLKQLARLPHEYETWLGFGHTIPNGDPPEPFADNTKCSGWILLPPPWFDDAMHHLSLEDGRVIEFISPIPLYREEMDLKLKKGAEALINRFETAKLPIEELFDPTRKNVAKKRFGIF